jgi:hypothetical protein
VISHPNAIEPGFFSGYRDGSDILIANPEAISGGQLETEVQGC